MSDEKDSKSPVGRPFLRVQFACCNMYQRIYRSADEKTYQGRCPKCGKPVRFVVGDGRRGWVDEGEEGWDVIHVGAAAVRVHDELIAQLRRPGR